MGWCSATEIFDAVCKALFDNEKTDKKEILEVVIGTLEYQDWDCQQDSDYWDNPIVQEVFRELHPSWYEKEE